MSSIRILIDYLSDEVSDVNFALQTHSDDAARFARLAQETTGKTRRIMLKLAADARSEPVSEAGHIIDLQLVPHGASGADRSYA